MYNEMMRYKTKNENSNENNLVRVKYYVSAEYMVMDLTKLNRSRNLAKQKQKVGWFDIC